ncbi:MAG: DNA-directed RNA polymerase subunit L [Candidatus Bathyarchaeota archaeon]|nr:DNA-directed RNA polymerase subunit L [Candidatus Bathyarchaeota archaeon]
MKINVTIVEDKYMEMEFSGESHTLLNLVQSNLLENSNVEMAGYSQAHPLMARSKLYVKLKRGKRHLDAIKKAAARADGKLDKFLSEFEKSLAKFKA